MPKEEWGTKRLCPTTGKRFYDLNKDPIVSPYTGEVVNLDTGGKSRVAIAEKAKAESEEEIELV
ncbi:MAG: TIGR02300 family protein, partial [Pseudomonadota bacterium]